ncbi:serine-rich adhesin for platelets-like [Impatiens glandulifera]|uniref:serine-rich adhesin for platelets-like n=1 Tax=Impatiens glandulifera TaxID=253017 RepID=UPI001FB0E0C3|nr:serine-rich adhesin for platelets-like [Impatiens glandulifera]
MSNQRRSSSSPITNLTYPPPPPPPPVKPFIIFLNFITARLSDLISILYFVVYHLMKPITFFCIESVKNAQQKLFVSKTTQSQLMDGNANASRSQLKANNRDTGFTSPLGVNDDNRYGARAPSVVARLMGLDSLPASTASEQTSAPVSNHDLIQHSTGQRSTNSFHFEHNIIYDNDTSRNVSHPIGSAQQRVHSRSIERFQLEIVPPKSARPVPVTHRLLPPIKGPGYMPTNVAYSSMEATTRIISEGPSSTSHDKMPSFRSSLPFQIRNLKQRDEGSEKGCEISQTLKSLNSYKSRKGQPRENVQIGSKDPQLPYTCLDSRRESKDKSVQIPKQEKANARRKGGLISSRNSGSINQKEGNEAVKLNHLNKRQSNMQKSVQKNSLSRASDVLKQNNQKQNCIANKDRGTAKAPRSKQNEQKSRSINGTGNANKDIGSLSAFKQINSMKSDSRKKPYPSNSKTFDQMNQSDINRNDHLVESGARKDMTHKAARSVMHNVSTDGYMNWDTNRIVSMDVVSFTFTSPIKKSMPMSMLSDRGAERERYGSNGSGGELYDSGSSSLASQGLDELLEQKLKELSSRVESFQYRLPDGLNSSSSSKLQHSPLKLKARCTTALEQGPKFLINDQDDRSTYIHDIPAYVDNMLLQDVCKQQPLEQIEENSVSTNPEYESELAGGYASPVYSLEPSSSVGSYDSSMSKGSNNSLLSSAIHHETMNYLTPQKLKAYEEVDMELSDSSSSTYSSPLRNGKDGSTTTTTTTNTAILGSSTRLSESFNWELEYLACIISHAELSLEDVVLDKGNPPIRQDLFDRLEYEKIGSSDEDDGGECLKVWRKVLFDYVGECFEESRRKLLSSSSSWGSCKEWSKWTEKNWWVAEELHKEMSGWMICAEEEDVMVDELVERDMSCGKGRWVDFETEAFEQGIEIERDILSSLVDELVSDILATGTCISVCVY